QQKEYRLKGQGGRSLLGVVVAVVPGPKEDLRADQRQGADRGPAPERRQADDAEVQQGQVDEQAGVAVAVGGQQHGRQQTADHGHEGDGRGLVQDGQGGDLDDQDDQERAGGGLGEQAVIAEGGEGAEVEQDDAPRGGDLAEPVPAPAVQVPARQAQAQAQR